MHLVTGKNTNFAKEEGYESFNEFSVNSYALQYKRYCCIAEEVESNDKMQNEYLPFKTECDGENDALSIVKLRLLSMVQLKIARLSQGE